MNAEINLGIDIGSMGSRAAGVVDGKMITLPEVSDDVSLYGRLVLEDSDSYHKTIRFPSIKSCIEKRKKLITLAGKIKPVDFVLNTLSNIKQTAEYYFKSNVGRTVIAVPATYSEHKRSILLKVADEVGLTNISLINDSMAIAMDFARQQPNDATYLICDSGYTQCEIALIRMTRYQFRALSYGFIDRPSGRFLDESILQGCVRASQEIGFNPFQQNLTPAQWFQLRQMVQNAKEKLDLYEDIHLSFIDVTNKGQNFYFPISKTLLNTHVKQILHDTIREITKTIQEAKLNKSNISQILLAGGTNNMEMIRQTFKNHFPNIPLCKVTQDSVARGAAAYAANLSGFKEVDSVAIKQNDVSVSTSNIDSDFLPLDIVKASVIPTSSQIAVTDKISPKSNTQPQSNSLQNSVPNIASLWKYSGELSKTDNTAAKNFLQDVINQANDQIKLIPQNFNVRNWRIKKAYKLIDQGRCAEAVEKSHVAYYSNKDNVKVFDDMIDIHCLAASTAQTLERYNDAVRWLGCALNHDQGALKVVDMLADRHFLHAQQLNGKGELTDALRTIKECLKLNQAHMKALELKNEISAKLKK